MIEMSHPHPHHHYQQLHRYRYRELSSQPYHHFFSFILILCLVITLFLSPCHFLSAQIVSPINTRSVARPLRGSSPSTVNHDDDVSAINSVNNPSNNINENEKDLSANNDNEMELEANSNSHHSNDISSPPPQSIYTQQRRASSSHQHPHQHPALSNNKNNNKPKHQHSEDEEKVFQSVEDNRQDKQNDKKAAAAIVPANTRNAAKIAGNDKIGPVSSPASPNSNSDNIDGSCLSSSSALTVLTELKSNFVTLMDHYLEVWRLESFDENQIKQLFEEKKKELKQKMKDKKEAITASLCDGELLTDSNHRASPLTTQASVTEGQATRRLLNVDDDDWFDNVDNEMNDNNNNHNNNHNNNDHIKLVTEDNTAEMTNNNNAADELLSAVLDGSRDNSPRNNEDISSQNGSLDNLLPASSNDDSPPLGASIHPFSGYQSAFTELTERDIASRHAGIVHGNVLPSNTPVNSNQKQDNSQAEEDYVSGFMASITPTRFPSSLDSLESESDVGVIAGVYPPSLTPNHFFPPQSVLDGFSLRSQREQDEDAEEERRKRREKLRIRREKQQAQKEDEMRKKMNNENNDSNNNNAVNDNNISLPDSNNKNDVSNSNSGSDEIPSIMAGVRAPPRIPLPNVVSDFPSSYIASISPLSLSPLAEQHSSHVFEEDELRDAYQHQQIRSEGSGSITAPSTPIITNMVNERRNSKHKSQRIWMNNNKNNNNNNNRNKEKVTADIDSKNDNNSPSDRNSSPIISSPSSSRSRLATLLSQLRSSPSSN